MFKAIRKWRKSRRTAASEREFVSAMQEINIDVLRRKLENSYIDVKNKNKDIAIFSTFCGPEHALSLAAPVHEIDIDCYFISNSISCLKKAKKLGWIPFYLEISVYKSPIISAHQAKIAKSLHHFFYFLREYDRVFYMDDKFKIENESAQKIRQNFSDNTNPFVVSFHPFLKRNIMFELAEAMGQRRYFAQRNQSVEFILSQIEKGYNLEVENLYATGLIMRDANNKKVFQINEDWYRAIMECGIECQLSFNFIAQKYPQISGFDANSLELRK